MRFWRACRCVALVYKVVTYLTRLETRIAEFSVAASQWVHAKPRGAMKVKLAVLSVDTRSAGLVPVAQCGPVPTACSGAEVELQLRDPKDGELRVTRTKSEETLMEVRSGSNVQIDHMSVL